MKKIIELFRRSKKCANCGHWRSLHWWGVGKCVACDCEAFVDEEK